MSRVMIFSRYFPAGHRRKGEQTYFPEKVMAGLVMAGLADILPQYKIPDEMVLWDWYQYYNAVPKWHTIRAGYNWKAGDKFSPRIWTDRARRSKQIIIGPDIEVTKTYSVKLNFRQTTPRVLIDGNRIDAQTVELLAKNDGMNVVDFKSWFSKPLLYGQIICWNKNIGYESE